MKYQQEFLKTIDITAEFFGEDQRDGEEAKKGRGYFYQIALGLQIPTQ